MITLAKFKVYRRLEGDIDSWIRSASNKDKDKMSDADWSLIDSLVQDLYLVAEGVTSKEYSDKVEQKLLENCDSQETVDQIRKIAKKRS